MRKFNVASNIGVGDNVFSCIAKTKSLIKPLCDKRTLDNIFSEAISHRSYASVINYLDTIIKVTDIDKLKEL